MTIRNFTPHSVNVYAVEQCEYNCVTRSYTPLPGEVPQAIYLSEGVARCSQTEVVNGEVDGIPLVSMSYGDVTLPEPEEGTVFIVSLIAMAAGKKLGRTDLVCPARPVRNYEGSIIGCCAFSH